jgi:hypothetical protein
MLLFVSKGEIHGTSMRQRLEPHWLCWPYVTAEQAAEKLKTLSFRSRRTFSVNRGALRAEASLFS